MIIIFTSQLLQLFINMLTVLAVYAFMVAGIKAVEKYILPFMSSQFFKIIGLFSSSKKYLVEQYKSVQANIVTRREARIAEREKQEAEALATFKEFLNSATQNVVSI